jgi:thiamine transporter ThiT
MSAKQKVSVSYIVSLCGIMCGLSLAVMFFLSMIPSFEYISPAAAGIFMWVIRERLGVKYGLVSYIAVGILCMFFTPNYEASMMFVFLLGYYPIVRQYIMKLKHSAVRWAAKLALYVVSCVSCYLLLIYLFGMKQLLEDMGEFGEYGSLIILGFGAAAFVMYDIFLGMFFPFYEKLLKPKISKRMR